jgi:hypothetical protein
MNKVTRIVSELVFEMSHPAEILSIQSYHLGFTEFHTQIIIRFNLNELSIKHLTITALPIS